MKSFIKTYATLYDALVKDIITTYPSLASDARQDLSRLLRSVQHEGIGFLTITHSDMEKAFLKALSQKEDLGSATELVRGFGAVSKTDRRPRYLHGLLSLIFLSDGTLRPDPDPTAVAFIRQWLSMPKKAMLPCSNDRIDATIREWIDIDRGLPDHWPDTWDADAPQWAKRTGHPLYGDNWYVSLPLFEEESVTWDLGSHWNTLRELCGSVVGSFGIFDPWTIRPKHGPGATADQDRGLKYEFPTWPAKLQSIFPWDFFACTDFGEYKRATGTEPATIEVPSVMYAVPKTLSGPRLIAAEPTAHQWIQGGIQRWFEDKVRESPLGRCIDFRDQRESQRLALEGSRDGSLATVDLSSASDRLSSRLVEYVFQCNPALLDGLHACRSRLLRLPNGELHRLRKFAPMGSAVTFPVQTIVFTVIALFSIMLTRGGTVRTALEEYTKEVRVFGDDIIVPVDAYPVLVRLLSTLRLKVNESKSFATGHFRESCGLDAFSGVDVTPVRVKRVYNGSDPTTLQSVVEASNLLFQRGFWHTSAALLETVPIAERKLLPVGVPVGGAVSLFSFMGDDVSHLRSQDDPHLQVRMVRCMTVQSRTRMLQSDGDAGLIQFFFEEPNPDDMYQSGQSDRKPSARKRVTFIPLSAASYGDQA